MTVGNIITAALKLINSAGDTEYTANSKELINVAQMELADIEKIKDIYEIIQIGQDIEEYNEYELPSNFRDLRYVEFEGNSFLDYKIKGNMICIPECYDGKFEIYYYKYPEEITSTTIDTTELEISTAGQAAIPYYVASLLILEEDKDLADRLFNIYNLKASRIKPTSDKDTSVINVTGW